MIECRDTALEIGVSHDEFWRLTPGQLRRLARAWRNRDDRRMFGLAWQVSWLLKPHLKQGKTLSPDELLGRSQSKVQTDPLDQLLSPRDKVVRLGERIREVRERQRKRKAAANG